MSRPAAQKDGGERMRRALWVLLCIFAFSLPLLEAPKNIVAAAFIVLWVVRAVRTGDAGGRWDRFDTAFVLMLAAATVAATVGGYAGALSGTVRVLALGWLARRTAFTRREQAGVLVWACVGLAGGIVAGAFNFFGGRKTFFELASVGHVNQSALYIAILAGAGLGWLLLRRRWQPRWTAWTALAALLFGATLLLTASRAALLAYVVLVLGLLLRLALRSRGAQAVRIAGIAALSLALMGGALLALGWLWPGVAGNKLRADQLVSTANVAHRVQHWRMAVEGWRQQPVFGFGPESFGRLSEQQVCAWKEQRGAVCRPADYAAATHAHSLYFAALYEQGLFGVAALAWMLAVWGWQLLRQARQRHDAWLWAGSAAAFAVVVVGGLFNTTLRVEHGSLALLMLALWLAPRRGRGV